MSNQVSSDRPRARQAGVIVGSLRPGPLNAITDVAGVRVGHTTLREGDSVRTGVTAILPHAGNLFTERVPAGIHVANGFGKLLGVTQVRELGELETPILLTSTLSVWKAADALATWLLAQPGMDDVRSVNPVVGETNDGFLNDSRTHPLRPEHVTRAIESATNGVVEEGAVGAGTGTVAFGWKGGIGTSSRLLPPEQGGYTVGVLVQSNYGGDLTISGVRLGHKPWESAPEAHGAASLAGTSSGKILAGGSRDGSIMIVVATDAPFGSRALERLAARAIVGLARTGSTLANGSGDYVIAFSTAPQCRRRRGQALHAAVELSNEAMSPLFQAVADATEEAIYNSLFQAETTQGFQGTVKALPIELALELLQKAGALGPKPAP